MSIDENGVDLGGHPPLYDSAEEMAVIIDEYFNYCDAKTKEIWSEKNGTMVVPDPQPYAMSGLAYALEMDRRSLINYASRDKFFLTLKRARERVEADVERRMLHKDTFTPGLIFNAKNNFDWKDKTEVDQNITGELKTGAIDPKLAEDYQKYLEEKTQQ